MHELLSHAPPREVWPALCAIAAFALGLYVVIASLEPPEPVRPWRWGEAPRRRSDESDGLPGFVAGMVLAFALVGFVADQLR